MGLLEEIAQATAARRAADAHEQKVREASGRRVAALQQAGLLRWQSEIAPAIRAALAKLNSALGGSASGDYVEQHSFFMDDAGRICVERGQVVTGEQVRVTLNYMRSGRPNHFINIALEANNGPDPIVLVIRHGERHVASRVVDDEFRLGVIESTLSRIIGQIEGVGVN